MNAWQLVVVVVATVRATRLVNRDYLIRPAVRWVQARVPYRVAYLLGCPWCLSVWVGAAVAAVGLWWPTNRAVWAVLIGLAASQLAGLAAVWLDPPDPVEDEEP